MAKKNKKDIELVEERVVEMQEEIIDENQIVLEPVVEETKEELVIEEPKVEPVVEEIKGKVVANVLHIGAPTEIPKELIKPKRTLDSLSKAEYRNYLRTGKIPE